MSDKPKDAGDEFDPDAFFEKFGEAELDRLGLDPEGVDLERLKELSKQAVGAHPSRDTLVEMMGFPHHFYAFPMNDVEFELRLRSLESGNYVTLGTLAFADIMRKPQG